MVSKPFRNKIVLLVVTRKMSNRTAGIIDAEIDAIKVNNPNWLADIGDKALITALTNC